MECGNKKRGIFPPPHHFSAPLNSSLIACDLGDKKVLLPQWSPIPTLNIPNFPTICSRETSQPCLLCSREEVICPCSRGKSGCIRQVRKNSVNYNSSAT